MANGLGLLGGGASTGPHIINSIHTVMTRQRTRQQARKDAFEKLRRDFGGFTPRGGHYWPEGMTRRVARQIARDKATKGELL